MNRVREKDPVLLGERGNVREAHEGVIWKRENVEVQGLRVIEEVILKEFKECKTLLVVAVVIARTHPHKISLGTVYTYCSCRAALVISSTKGVFEEGVGGLFIFFDKGEGA